ncbi:NUDIX domain-containing protein [Sporolactobacillus laevolacticus]|uniref:NUDIX domain-containing protein n=1 Tax=Sporolactobacillus laevolacticus TaxID=33018 RepID=UPI0004275AEB|nr:NUDIX domain-containing protein [Sporolactobacillus laevolacticus]
MGYIEQIRALVGHRPIILNVAGALIVDELGRVLLQKRTFPSETWGIPCGMMELGESTKETAKREIFEETGLTIAHLHLFNVYSGSSFTKRRTAINTIQSVHYIPQLTIKGR